MESKKEEVEEEKKKKMYFYFVDHHHDNPEYKEGEEREMKRSVRGEYFLLGLLLLLPFLHHHPCKVFIISFY
jgi:hypothetical protein